MGADLSIAVEYDGSCVMYCHRVWRGAWLDDAIKVAGGKIEPASLDAFLFDHYDPGGTPTKPCDPPYWLRAMTPAALAVFIARCEGGTPMPIDDEPLDDGTIETEVVEMPSIIPLVLAFANGYATYAADKPDGVRIIFWYGP